MAGTMVDFGMVMLFNFYFHLTNVYVTFAAYLALSQHFKIRTHLIFMTAYEVGTIIFSMFWETDTWRG